MENIKTSPYTRTSTSASALNAEPMEDILRRAGVQMLGLLDFAAALARIPAARQALLRYAPDADRLLQPIPSGEGEPDQHPKTIAERITFVRRALVEADASEEMSLRAFVHLIVDEVRAAHPRLSWAEIAEILQKAGFTGATADNVRQSAKSAPIAAVVPPQDERVTSTADGAPPSMPGQAGRVIPAMGMPTMSGPAVGDARFVPTQMPYSAPLAPLTASGSLPAQGSKPSNGNGGRPPETPHMPWSAQIARTSADTHGARPDVSDETRDSRPQFDLNQGRVPDPNSMAPVREATHLTSGAGQPAGAPPRPISQPQRPVLEGAFAPRSGPMMNPQSGVAPRPAPGADHRSMTQRDLPSDPAPAAPAWEPDRSSVASTRPDVLSQHGGMPVVASPTPPRSAHVHHATSLSPAIPSRSIGQPMSVARPGPTPVVPRPNWSAAAPAPAHPEDPYDLSASRSQAVPDKSTSDDDADDCFGSGPRI